MCGIPVAVQKQIGVTIAIGIYEARTKGSRPRLSDVDPGRDVLGSPASRESLCLDYVNIGQAHDDCHSQYDALQRSGPSGGFVGL